MNTVAFRILATPKDGRGDFESVCVGLPILSTLARFYTNRSTV